jgi:DNA-binding NarL/FixJ family response regulator
MIDVVVVDNHRLVRRAIITLLTGAVGIDIVGEGENGEDAIRLIAEQAPDVVVMDLAMPTMNGIEALQELEGNHPPVLILSMHGDKDVVQTALDAGATGYLLKRSAAGELVEGINAVHAGERYLSEELRRMLGQ